MRNWVIKETKVPDYERVVYCEDPKSRLRSIVAIHNTHLGPSCGGIRLLPYKSQAEALEDVLRLAKGMSYKSALAGIDFGGGKSVILADPSKKNPALLHAFGEFVESFAGQYIAAKDMNINSDDLSLVKEKTKHVLGVKGVPGSSGDPSPVTARGVIRAFEAVAEELGSRSLSGMKVAIQGIGHVGYALAEHLKSKGAQLWVSDVNPKSLRLAQEKLGAKVVEDGDAIYDLDVDVFSPNARGAILNKNTVPRLKVKAIVGAANNQLETFEDGIELHSRGIFYAPDFAVNAGGIINIFVEYEGYNALKALEKTDAIYETIKQISQRARESKKPPFLIADKMAEERIYGTSWKSSKKTTHGFPPRTPR